jgi:5-methylcytosine-specific restriction enzyme A
MLNRGERKKLKYSNGRYYVDVDISKEEWLDLLNDPEVFDKYSLDMVIGFYLMKNHQAASKEMKEKYYPTLKGTPYNGIVIALGKKILKKLNYRFYIESSDSEKSESFWSIPFEGYHVNYDPSQLFIWKLRDELVSALDIFLNKSL